MPSFKNPISTNPILGDVTQIRELFTVLAKVNPALADDIPEGAVRIIEVAGTAKLFRVEKYTNGAWVSLGQLDGASNSLAGYEPSTTAKPNAIPVYNASGQLVGSITGNAATATKLATPRSFQVGGIAASTAQNFDGTANVTIPINSITINNAADTAVNGTLTAKHGGTGRTDGASLNVVMSSLSGDVLAKSYGLLGPMILKNFSTSLDSLIVQGKYYVSSATTTDWDKNKFPTNSQYYNRILTDYYGNDVLQRYIGQYGGAWKRFSNNKGASWTGWLPLDICTVHTAVYISKSGNNVNTGTSSSYPVLTWSRACQVADALARRGDGAAYVYFRFGEGSWGNITIRALHYLAIIQPYDGGTATGYSTSLPAFGNVTCEASYIWFGTCVANWLIATQKGHIYLLAGYKRIGGLQPTQFGSIHIQSQNAATNLIDFLGGNYTPFYIFSGGSIYAQYVHLRLCGNLTTNFIYMEFQSFLSVYNGQTVYDATAFSNSSYKYSIYRSFVVTGEGAGGLAWLNALPGASAGRYDAACLINGVTSALVKKTGDQMTGELSIVRNGRAIWTRDTGLNRNASPSANLYRRQIEWYDNQSAAMGAIQAGFTTAQRFHLGFFAQRVVSGVTRYGEIGGWINNDGTSGGYAPTPAANSNTNDIATTAWVRTHVTSVVGANTGGTVVDNKTLNNVTLNNSKINFSTTTLTGTPSFTDNDDKIPNLYWVNVLCGSLFYGMCPQANISTNTFYYNTWLTAPCNGYVVGSFQGRGSQYWRTGPNTTNYNQFNAGTVASAFTFPIQNTCRMYIYDAGCSSSVALGWWPAIPQHGWSNSRPSARSANANAAMPGYGMIYLKIVGDEVEACADLICLADFLGMDVPDPGRLEFEKDGVEDFWQSGIAKIENAYQEAVTRAQAEYEENLKLADFDIGRMEEALAKEAVDPDDMPLETRLHFILEDEKRILQERLGQRMVEIQAASRRQYDEFLAEFVAYQAEAIKKRDERIEEVRKQREEICAKAAEMADKTITGETWSEYRCAAHLENGKIILGNTREMLEYLLQQTAEQRLQEYDRRIRMYDRQLRFADIADKYKSGKGAAAISRFMGRRSEIERKMFEWDLYAAEIATMPDKNGFPWDGGDKHTPWPTPPASDEEPLLLG